MMSSSIVQLHDNSITQYRGICKKISGSIVKKWIYTGGLSPIAELESSNNVTAEFAGSLMIKNGNTYQLITDHLGSVRLVIAKNTGDIVQQMDYDEFGNVISDSNPDFQPFAYAGGLYDTQTKLTRFGARDYDAVVGRWVAKDPIGFEGNSSNFYEYCLNDPINLIDPTGRQYIPFEQSFSAYLGVEGIGAMGGYVISGAITVQGNSINVIVSAKPKSDAIDNISFYGKVSIIICDQEINSASLVNYGNAGIFEQGSSYVGEVNFELNQGTIILPDDLNINPSYQRISVRIEVGYSSNQPEGGSVFPYPYMQGMRMSQTPLIKDKKGTAMT